MIFVVFLQCQIVVRGREQFAFAAIFKLDLSDPHNEDIAHKVMSSVFLSLLQSTVWSHPCRDRQTYQASRLLLCCCEPHSTR